jgi:DNA repair exonuclease SbcCD ATPase subunit
MHNNLFLNRLIIYTNEGKIAYDERFHRGVNIIRGKNSSGKSTITHFIFYVLGGAFNSWVKEARECSVVFAETEMNGATITLKRQIIFNETGRANDKEGIYFFFDSYDIASKSNEGWMYFGYNATDSRKSFSNVIFDQLNIPTVKGENNITFHQLLRLIYIDQDSPTSSLFLYEQFDTNLTRDTVSEILLGVYNQDLYDAKQELITVEKRLDDVKSEIRVMDKNTHNPYDLIPVQIKRMIEDKIEEISKKNSEIQELSNAANEVLFTKKSELDYEQLMKQAVDQRKKLIKQTELTNSLHTNIVDTKFFVEALENKIIGLKNSVQTRNVLGDVDVEYCPKCLQEITTNTDDESCDLCKSKLTDHEGATKIRKIEQQIFFQIKESKGFIREMESQMNSSKARLRKEKEIAFQLQTRVNQALNNITSFRNEKLNKLYEDKGFLEGEILQYNTLLEVAEKYQGLKNEKKELDSVADELKRYIYRSQLQQEQLKETINRWVEENGVYLLNNDFKRQNEFFEATEFHVDYRNNIAFISDKEARYSASSSFYLKISARFAIFLSSLQIENMRYPRFILCDNMEDKGIEKERAQNFQRILIDQLKGYSRESYQVIYTTSFIPDEFNNDQFCVGEYYDESNRSLKNVKSRMS